MTLPAKILSALRATDRLCDDCLSEATGVGPRKSIGVACLAMKSGKMLRRFAGTCVRCRRTKIVNCACAGDCPEVHEPAPLACAAPPVQRGRAAGAANGAIAKRCYLVACVGAKQAVPSKAKDLYVSRWFRKARLYVEASGDPWFILSAQYGLVDPEAVVAPYGTTLKGMPVAERREWAAMVMSQMDSALPQTDAIVVFASARFREFLMDYLRFRAKEVLVPMEGLVIGKQMTWLGSRIKGRPGSPPEPPPPTK